MTDPILAHIRSAMDKSPASVPMFGLTYNGKDFTAAQVAAALDAITPEPPFVLGAPVALKDCPIGLFMCGETMALKSEYGNNEGRIDAYIVESGEFFWGDQPQTIASQRAQMVRPVEITPAALDAITPEREPHKTRPVWVLADIDLGIAEMVEYLQNIPGVRTDAACQGTIGEGGPNPYRAQVMAHWPKDTEARLLAEFDITFEGECWGYLHPRPGWRPPATPEPKPMTGGFMASQAPAMLDELMTALGGKDAPLSKEPIQISGNLGHGLLALLASVMVPPEPDPFDDEDVKAVAGVMKAQWPYGGPFDNVALKIVQTLHERWKAEPVSQETVSEIAAEIRKSINQLYYGDVTAIAMAMVPDVNDDENLGYHGPKARDLHSDAQALAEHLRGGQWPSGYEKLSEEAARFLRERNNNQISRITSALEDKAAYFILNPQVSKAFTDAADIVKEITK